jgi:hypothetical protein
VKQWKGYNFHIMLQTRFWLILWWFITLILAPVGGPPGPLAYAQVTPVPDVVIVSPQPGEALQGVVAIRGRTTVSGFKSAEILFGYANDPSQTWFFITESTSPVEAGLLTEWDTSTLTDGDYTLRLVVNRTNGSRAIVIVPGLRIRNYSPVETDTPMPVFTPTASATPLPGSNPKSTATDLPTATPLPPTITPLPTNPAMLSQQDVSTSLLRGAAGTCIALVGIGLYLAVRKLIRR